MPVDEFNAGMDLADCNDNEEDDSGRLDDDEVALGSWFSFAWSRRSASI